MKHTPPTADEVTLRDGTVFRLGDKIKAKDADGKAVTGRIVAIHPSPLGNPMAQIILYRKGSLERRQYVSLIGAVNEGK